jgi:hypothetical protein
MKLKLISSLLLAGLLAGCGKGGGSNQGGEASLAELNRAASAVAMMNGGRPPRSVDELTNLLSQQSLRLPTPPAGKKLVIDASGQVSFGNQ